MSHLLLSLQHPRSFRMGSRSIWTQEGHAYNSSKPSEPKAQSALWAVRSTGKSSGLQGSWWWVPFLFPEWPLPATADHRAPVYTAPQKDLVCTPQFCEGRAGSRHETPAPARSSSPAPTRRLEHAWLRAPEEMQACCRLGDVYHHAVLSRLTGPSESHGQRGRE